jgi:hypothetical protein
VSPASTSIPTRQNEPALLALLRAMSVSHRRAQRLDLLRTAAAVGLAGAGLVAVFQSSIATPVTVLGAAWAVLYSLGLASWNHQELRRAATLQEMFDVRLFGMPWNAVTAGEPLAAQEVSNLERRYRGREDLVRDYYEIPDLPAPYDVLACQQQNLGWGARVRRRYARVVLAAICGWSATGLVLGAVARLDITQLLLRWYIPSLAILLVGLEVYRGQREVAEERERALAALRSRVTRSLTGSPAQAADAALLPVARQLQDLIFQGRRRHSRVPDWFFLRYRESDRTDFRAAMVELQNLVTAPSRSPATE